MLSSLLEKLVLESWGIKAKLKEIYGELDLNFLVDSDSQKYILKLHHPDTQTELLNYQNEVLGYLQTCSLEFQLPHLIRTKDEEPYVCFEFKQVEYQVRLLSWVEGALFSEIACPSEVILADLGKKNGQLTSALLDYKGSNPEGEILWAPSELDWITDHLQIFETHERELLEYYLKIFDEKKALISSLRKSVIYMDANDNNIIVGPEKDSVSGFIDFGDSCFTYSVNEIAVSLAYGMMNFPEPLTAGRVILHNFNQYFKLSEEELDVLYILIAARLMISVTFSTIRRKEEQGNEYHQISEKPAWDLLKKWGKIHPDKAVAFFRYECGYEPIKGSAEFIKTLRKTDFSFVLGDHNKGAKYSELDLSVGTLEFDNAELDSPDKFETKIRERCEKEDTYFLAGGYLENRMVYSEDRFFEEGNWGQHSRTVHLGHDYWLPAGAELFCPWEGCIYSAVDNKGEGNYGPTIIIEHQLEGEKFYTLFGHLSRSSIGGLQPGDIIKKGQKIAELGQYHENGNWVPHLHFQLIREMWGEEEDFDGVAFSNEIQVMATNCPSPEWVTQIRVDNSPLDPIQVLHGRKNTLGRNLSVSYKEPLVILRGKGQYLFDYRGHRYLDTVNNVAHVGHQHPKVVDALTKQAGVLNTNTRYLHPEIVKYAEELTDLFPDPLSVCFFVNSGSEANELALRMAKTITGRKGIMAMEMGYHGNTTSCIEVSSYKFDRKGGRGKPSSTEVLPSPDPYRRPEIVQGFKSEVEKIFNSLDEDPAAIISESILSCAGQVVPPEGYYQEVHQKIKERNALFIADEVQVGFGRVGSHWWGFQLHGITPDIVTLGKPIGNGHPLGAVVTTREIADEFAANGMEFFNTYGGNPVSCSVGRSVLDIIKSEGLKDHALQMGQLIQSRLRDLQQDFPIIGDIRGHGLFLGFELTKNSNPATKEARRLVNAMQKRGVLMSSDGPDENVIKIKPPMCIQAHDIEYMMTQLAVVLADI